jgi:hypothetical protein
VKILREKGYAIIALNPKQTRWDPVRKLCLVVTPSSILTLAAKRDALQQEKVQACAKSTLTESELTVAQVNSEIHIQYVMDNVLSLSPAARVFIFAHWGSCREILQYLNSNCTCLKFHAKKDDEKWTTRLAALGMAQGTFPVEEVTSAKFRVFLAEKAINYLFLANVGANVLLNHANIGCPNIAIGPGISFLVEANQDCVLYDYMATLTLDKMVHFFEGGQSAILSETVVEEPLEPDDELDTLGNWDDLKEKMESGDMEKLLEVGIGAGADDSEWFRVRR